MQKISSRRGATLIAFVVMLALTPTKVRAKLFVRFQPDQRLSNIEVQPGDLIPLVITEDTNYRTRAARLGCHIWCVDHVAQLISVTAPDSNATISDLLIGDTSPPSDFTQISFNEDVADPSLWAGGPHDVADITFRALAPGTLDQMINSFQAFDDQGNSIPFDVDTTSSFTVTVVPEPTSATILGIATACGVRRPRGRKSLNM